MLKVKVNQGDGTITYSNRSKVEYDVNWLLWLFLTGWKNIAPQNSTGGKISLMIYFSSYHYQYVNTHYSENLTQFDPISFINVRYTIKLVSNYFASAVLQRSGPNDEQTFIYCIQVFFVVLVFATSQYQMGSINIFKPLSTVLSSAVD